MSPLDAIALLLVVLVPANLVVAIFLGRLSWQYPDISTLRSRAFTQIVLTGVSAVFGYFGLADLLGFPVTADTFTVLLAGAGIAVSLPGLNWAIVYITGRLA